MTHLEIRQKFLEFFKERDHAIVPSSSLLPTDLSVLFTTAGMQQFKSYYTGEGDAIKDFGSLNTVSIQKCVRTSDIDEVGDESHLTFFEMLGNFSFGGYGKKEAIEYAYEFIAGKDWMNLKIDYVSVFGSEGDLPADEESEEIWKSVAPDVVIKKFGRADNFWGPTGDEGPCGPTTEIYVNGVEIWNIVFNQYYQHVDGRLEPLKIKGIDTGMGLERLATMIQGKKNIFETDLLLPIFELLPDRFNPQDKRIIIDHTRAAVFLISDGFKPSNKDQGYILRRLLRRIMVRLAIGQFWDDSNQLFEKIVEIYKPIYKNFDSAHIIKLIAEESAKFNKTLGQGLKELDKLQKVDAKNAFKLFETFGLPFETIKDLGGEKTKELTREKFDEEFRKHQELSRTASAGMFKGGLADTSVQTTRLHTAAHLMLEALRRILGDRVQQKGSNITSERLRFDFSHGEKITLEQIKKVEEIVNEQIEKKLPVHFEEMSVDEAKKLGATGVFEHKYGEKVKVYFVGDDGNYFSKEICGGPHVSNTAEIGYFKIIKEESVSAGVRRIKAIVTE